MEQRALTTINLEETLSLGQVLAESKFFSDAQGAAQAVVKVLAGREMGFGPIASMTGVYIVKGKPTIGANLLGAAIKRHPRYDYRVIALTEARAEIAFYQDGSEIGRSTFTMEDAGKAGLSGKGTWKQYPRNMLFSRAMSNGARWYCPDVFGGVTPYTPEEISAEGEIIDVTPTGPTWEPMIVEAGEDAVEEQPSQEQGSSDPGINSPKALLAAVNKETGGYYDAPRHLYNALVKDLGEGWIWPPADDVGAWKKAYDAAVGHAAAKMAERGE